MSPPDAPSLFQQHLITQISEAFKIIRQSKGAGKRSIRLSLLRNFTAEYLTPFIRAYFARAGIEAKVDIGGFDTVQQDIFEGRLLGECDLLVMALDLQGLAPDWIAGGEALRGVAERVTGLVSSALERVAVPVVINTFIRPLHDSAGLNALTDDGSADAAVLDINRALRDFARERRGRVVLVDWERLAMMAGAEGTFDPRMAYMARSPFKPPFLSAYAHEIFKIGNALRGGAKKCLILDCDNTLWGGVVGEVGVEGIALDPNSYPGRAFYDFQRSVLRLGERGVMLALCSKNNPEDALAVFDKHPDCLIKREHLVGWRINWEDKERNIAEMVREFNIGLDAVVFVDDNPTECARVRSFLPDITVRQVPEALFTLPALLDAEGLFSALAVTEEDRGRSKMYQAESRRQEAEAGFASVEDFLASLELSACIQRFTVEHPAQLARVAQLTQKTNQFNLTTRRYSEAEIIKFAGDPHSLVMGMTVADRFGDFGLTGVVIAHVAEKTARIDSFLMSCRVLGRNLEKEFATRAIETLRREWGVDTVAAEYIPTAKNSQVAKFWANFGLQVSQDTLERTSYSSNVNDIKLVHIPYIKVNP